MKSFFIFLLGVNGGRRENYTETFDDVDDIQYRRRFLCGSVLCAINTVIQFCSPENYKETRRTDRYRVKFTGINPYANLYKKSNDKREFPSLVTAKHLFIAITFRKFLKK